MFTDEDVAEGEKFLTLGPAYFDARRVAEGFMEKFEAEHFKPLIDKLTDQIRERLWDDLKDYLLGDVESNLQGEMWRMTDNCVQAILGGAQWAMNKYALGERYDCDKVREAVAKHVPVELQDKRIADLEAEVARLKESLRFHQNRY